DEALLAEAEADLVVAVALGIVEIPLPARLAAQAADTVVLAGPEIADAAMLLMRLPFRGVEAATLVERHEQVVSLVAVAGGVPLLAGEKQPHVAKFRGKVFQLGHASLHGSLQYSDSAR